MTLELHIHGDNGSVQLSYALPDIQDLELLSDAARARLLSDDRRDHIALDWDLALSLLHLAHSEDDEAEDHGAEDHRAGDRVAEGKAAETAARGLLPDWLEVDDVEIVGGLLQHLELPAAATGQVRVWADGRAGSAGYVLRSEWVGAGGRALRPQPEVMGGLVYGKQPDGSHAPPGLLTLGQHRVLAALSAAPALGQDRNTDLLATEDVCASIPSADGGVLLDAHLARTRVVKVAKVKPLFVATPQGYELRPKVDGVPQAAIEDHYYGTAASELANSRLTTRDGEQRTRTIISEDAAQGMLKCRELREMPAEDVAHAMSHPEEVLGTALDLSEFSDRVAGLGPLVHRVLPVLREIKTADWWDWDVEAEVQNVASKDGEQAAADQLDLKDPQLRAVLQEKIARAEARGDTYIPHPSGEGMLELTPRLKESLEAIDELEAAKADNGGKLPLPPNEVLQVKENLESLVFDRGQKPPPKPPRGLGAPPGLASNITLHPHQQRGYEWLVSLYEGTGAANTSWNGALLADDMGVGKTLQVLSFLAWLKGSGHSGPNLVVAPVGLLQNWQDEAAAFFGTSLGPTLQVSGRYLDPDPAIAAHQLGARRIVFTSYETLRRNEQTFARVPWNLVAMDEAQKAKNPGSQVARVVRTLKARFRLAMTGTPVENSLSELWTLYDWAVPGLLGSLRTFADDYIKPIKNGGIEAQQQLAGQLQEQIQPVFIRRMKGEILRDLPRLHRHPHTVALSAEQEQRYDEQLEQPGGRGQALGRLTRLFGVCAHPRINDSLPELPTSADDPFPKEARLWEILDGVRSSGEKAIVFANRKKLHRWLRTEIESRYELEVDLVDGQVNDSKARMAKIRRFGEKEGFNVIILSTRAAGVGLNITAANHVIHYTREWNPAVENQATDRAYRIGQTLPVQVHTLIATSSRGTTVDQRLDELLERKRELMRQFVVPMGGFDLTAADLQDARS